MFKKSLLTRIEKRQRFIIATTLLTLLYTGATFFSFEWAIVFVPIIAVAVYCLTYFGILEGITRHERVMLFIHPIYFSIVFYLFYFFVPQRWLTRIPFITIYVISIYALFLSQNIFNVGVSKSLQLFRAAFSVNYLFITISSFLAYSLIVSLRLHGFFNLILIFLASFPLVLHMLWSVEPTERVEGGILSYAFLISLLLSELGLILSFVPVNQSIFALAITSVLYGWSGLVSTHMYGSLYREKLREYLFVFGFALVVLILTIKW
jgi:hypothetical protein